ncbi:acyl-CoA dehydratase activase [Desulfurivibrio alkaliphilus]|uniref:CoA-substrate-specific enzyme activase n=1 Tax=Desulfurivibrio alkaliphilus (strain DSM 19089 / UNIQEM U267 / AHT2) TaxID=589865 RepID=D6Z036_DESAT|nr:acyl-CoA dehydratase activase [Desulfurivibrio alkaliphilus]ADH87069.1 CoA-substrate-specific enzyme activase [Desulfurivibrio alkaliphilus AHT 2]
MQALGICLGASTISMVGLTRDEGGKITISLQRKRSHEGNPRRVLTEMLATVEQPPGLKVAATGRKFRNHLALSTIPEPEAVEQACRFVLPPDHSYRTVVSAGGETFMVYRLDDDGRIQHIQSGNKCASGTGEFLLQQLGRMSLSLEDVEAMGQPAKRYQVSGRCSVFCKSDCTHALNKGIPKDQVVAGLSRMMAGKILELLKKMPSDHVLLIGGCAANQSMVHYLREEIADLAIPDPADAPPDAMEALGAALWALEHETRPLPAPEQVFSTRRGSFSHHQPLTEFRRLVDFKPSTRGQAAAGDRCILGLDVGSTTTKGVIMRRSDKAIIAADYLRTDGDPVGASRRVYASLAQQLGPELSRSIIIEALGVTGSGRQIAGLHALSEGVINEIIAHATAAVHFDPEVDTIFEIGGQDAKYTYITNGVPSDYAMNEACSAGTGSFLEEAAKESLGIGVTEIGETAYRATSPPNFNDQCAAFIGSDIKSAAQEGVPLEDIVAGLVYSICMNYTNRVKGNRPVGRKVFIQGGVCYNEAVPAAMAALTGKEMVVPPDPGLMGAFGVALEAERRLEQGLLEPDRFDLNELAVREVEYGQPFKCGGGKDCDRGCEISRIIINGKSYPFGGICNRYDNIIHRRKVESSGLDLVVQRERRAFRDAPQATTPEVDQGFRAPVDAGSPPAEQKTVGINRSFLINTFFPLFNRFFQELGFKPVLSEKLDPNGVDKRNAPFCYPVELAHGLFADLLDKKPDYLFLPHIRAVKVTDDATTSCICPFVQGEPYYLRATFPAAEQRPILTPVFDFSQGFAANLTVFQDLARQLGADPRRAEAALKAAIADQESFRNDLKEMGRQALAELERDPESTAVVLFGRPYNSLVREANKGIPAKFASRGIRIIPIDMLPFEDEPLSADMNMYWAMGRMIMKAARLVKNHPQLYGTYITNFSCGPDSFLLTYFRDMMGSKPSLTLELDSHTADAGLETRIEAFLDIVRYYRQIQTNNADAAEAEQPTQPEQPAPQVDPGPTVSGPTPQSKEFKPAVTEMRGDELGIRLADGSWVPMTDPRVKVLVPAMGPFGTSLVAAAFGRRGIRAEALPPADEEALKLGRGNSSCKECLPLQTTVGTMLQYLQQKRPEGEITAYFMATTEGPCRFGQYHVFSHRTIVRHQIPDAAVMSLTSTNSYGGLGNKFTLAAWRAIIIGDLLNEIWSTIQAGAKDKEAAEAIFWQEQQKLEQVIASGWATIARQLKATARELGKIELHTPHGQIPKLSLVGEIYVRHDPISLQRLIERLAAEGFIVRTSQVSEWIKYCDWLVKNRIEGKPDFPWWTRYWVKRYFDAKIRKLMAPCGLFHYEEKVEVEPLIAAGRRHIAPELAGEAILTVGAALHEILHPSCGIISIGPFGCMPTRLAESILNEKFTSGEKRQVWEAEGHRHIPALLQKERKLPFLALETDGNAFPQIIEARLEAFALQAKRVHEDLVNE